MNGDVCLSYQKLEKKESLIIIIERNKFNKDTQVIQEFLKTFEQLNIPAIFFESKVKWIVDKYRNSTVKYTGIAYLDKWLWGALHIKYWPYITLRNSRLYKLWEIGRMLKKHKKMDSKREVVLVGRSFGAILATQASLMYPVSKIICLGYPFKSPSKQYEEPYRTYHLNKMSVPIFIAQGKQDQYGGEEVEKKYSFSPTTQISFFDTDHDFELDAEEKKRLTLQIKAFLEVS